jgi:hypothetical protein
MFQLLAQHLHHLHLLVQWALLVLLVQWVLLVLLVQWVLLVLLVRLFPHQHQKVLALEQFLQLALQSSV